MIRRGKQLPRRLLCPWARQETDAKSENYRVPHNTPSARLLLLFDLVDLGRLPLHLTGTGQRSVNLPHGLKRLYVLSRRERTRDDGPPTQNQPNIGVGINLQACFERGKTRNKLCRSGRSTPKTSAVCLISDQSLPIMLVENPACVHRIQRCLSAVSPHHRQRCKSTLQLSFVLQTADET